MAMSFRRITKAEAAGERLDVCGAMNRGIATHERYSDKNSGAGKYTAIPRGACCDFRVAKNCRNFQKCFRLKWPNDILLNGKKVCGILLEAQWNASQMRSAIIGIGINIRKQLSGIAGCHCNFALVMRHECGSKRCSRCGASQLRMELETKNNSSSAS